MHTPRLALFFNRIMDSPVGVLVPIHVHGGVRPLSRALTVAEDVSSV